LPAHPGPADIITDGKDGYLIKSMDQDVFCSKLSSLMLDENLRKEMGANAREDG
jgi:glycosyltransferase involved in cell wall biosynthesis